MVFVPTGVVDITWRRAKSRSARANRLNNLSTLLFWIACQIARQILAMVNPRKKARGRERRLLLIIIVLSNNSIMSLSPVHKLGAAVLAEMLDSDSSDDMEETDWRHHKKKRTARLLNTQTALHSTFYVRYLKLADDSMKPSSTQSIFYDSSHLGKVFQRWFRPPLFNVRSSLQKIADDRKSHDVRGTKKHDVCLLALGTFCLIARDLVFDDLEELNGISATANHAFFYSFVPWLAGLANSLIVSSTKNWWGAGAHISALYRVVGLPRCVGSANCIHVFWDMCPAHL
jgi:hypothetical protein